MKTLFGAHETFHLREGWLRKGLLGIQKNPHLFSDPYPGDTLGVGHNMVAAIRYWLQATGLAEATYPNRHGRRVSRFHLTSLAKVMLDQDPYFEDDGTLWVLHYHLATNKEFATTWYWFFNVFGIRQFTQDLLLSHLQRFVEGDLRRTIKPRTLESDFRCLIRTYTRNEEKVKGAGYEDSYDCPLAGLNLIQLLPLTRTFRLVPPAHDTLHPLLVGYALMEMGAHTPYLRAQASLRDAQFEARSPGRVFALDSEALYEYLIRLEKEHRGLISFSRTAGQNLIMIKPIDSLEVLKRYYQGAGILEGALA